MKTRLKKNAGEMLTRTDVEQYVQELRQLAIAEQKVLADKNAAVAEIEARCAPALEQIATSKKQLLPLIESWALANPDLFAKKKSIEFTHGTIGFRLGTPKLALLSRKFTWESALEAVQHWLPNFIRNAPEIDKAALIAQRDEPVIQETLTKCGLKVTNVQSFFVDTKLDQVEAVEKSEVAA